VNNACVRTVDRQWLKSNFLGEVVSVFILRQECRSGRIGCSFILHRVSIAAPVRLFLQQEKVAMPRAISRRQPAYATTDDHHIVARRSRRTGEHFSIPYLVTDSIVFALHVGGVIVLGVRGLRRD